MTRLNIKFKAHVDTEFSAALMAQDMKNYCAGHDSGLSDRILSVCNLSSALVNIC